MFRTRRFERVVCFRCVGPGDDLKHQTGGDELELAQNEWLSQLPDHDEKIREVLI